MGQRGIREESADLEIRRQLEDWQRGLVDTYESGRGPCPVCDSRWRHLCRRCADEIDGRLAYELARNRDRVRSLAAALAADLAGYVEVVRAAGLVRDAVLLIDYGDAVVREARQAQFALLLWVLEENRPLGPLPGGDLRGAWERVGGGAGAPAALIRELACKNLPVVAPTADQAARPLSGLLGDPQQGVAGWAALHLAGLSPGTPGLARCLAEMAGWPGCQLASAVDWDGQWSDGAVAGEPWAAQAEEALRRLTGGTGQTAR